MASLNPCSKCSEKRHRLAMDGLYCSVCGAGLSRRVPTEQADCASQHLAAPHVVPGNSGLTPDLRASDRASDDVRRRDRVLRAYLTDRDWGLDEEANLFRQLVLNPPDSLMRFPYLYDYEWQVVPGRQQDGRGDLVFTDGDGRYAVVEVKWIDTQSTGSTARKRRTAKRRKVEEQLETYAAAFKIQHPAALSVIGLEHTNEMVPNRLLPLDGPESSLSPSPPHGYGDPASLDPTSTSLMHVANTPPDAPDFTGLSQIELLCDDWGQRLETWAACLKESAYQRGAHLGEVVELISTSRRGLRYQVSKWSCCGQAQAETSCRRLPSRYHPGGLYGGGSRSSGGAHQYKWDCCYTDALTPGCCASPAGNGEDAFVSETAQEREA